MIRIGIIGYGYWGPNLVRNFAEMRGAEAAAVADVDRTKLESVQPLPGGEGHHRLPRAAR